jgi:hypothetical protein
MIMIGESIAWGALFGLFITLALINGVDNIISKIVIILVPFAVCSILVYNGYQQQENRFNNGYCIDCDLKMIPIEHHQNSTYYECPNCYNGVWH